MLLLHWIDVQSERRAATAPTASKTSIAEGALERRGVNQCEVKLGGAPCPARRGAAAVANDTERQESPGDDVALDVQATGSPIAMCCTGHAIL